MSTKITMHADFNDDAIDVEPNSDLKRKAWLAAFAGSFMFWVVVALMAWRLLA